MEPWDSDFSDNVFWKNKKFQNKICIMKPDTAH